MQNIPDVVILVTADTVNLYPSIPHYTGLRALKKALDNRESTTSPIKNLIKMVEFELENNYFEFDGKVKQQVSGTEIGTKFAPSYT